MIFSNIELIHGFFPLPVLLWGIAAVFGGVGVYALTGLIFPKDSVNLTILGMQRSGKTTLWNGILEGNELKHSQSTATITQLDEKVVEINGVRKVFKNNFDIPGTIDYVRLEYKNLIEENDFVIFSVSGPEYLSNLKYQDEANARLSFIKYFIDKKDFHILITHTDQLQREADKNRILKILNKTDLFQHIKSEGRVAFLNLLNQNDINGYINNIFSN
jgi:GTPase SAR1 family protein